MSAGQVSSGRRASTASWLDPESNQTSRMSYSRSNDVPPHSQASPAGTKFSIGCSYQASAVCSSNTRAACSTSAGVRIDVPHPRHVSAGIGTPQARWREMHQSGRFANMPVMRSRPQAGIHRTALASALAVSRRPSMLMNHCDVAMKITG